MQVDIWKKSLPLLTKQSTCSPDHVCKQRPHGFFELNDNRDTLKTYLRRFSPPLLQLDPLSHFHRHGESNKCVSTTLLYYLYRDWIQCWTSYTARAEQLFTRGYSGIGALRGPQTCELLMNIHIDGGIQPMK